MKPLRTAILILLLIPTAIGFLLVVAGLALVDVCREIAKGVVP